MRNLVLKSVVIILLVSLFTSCVRIPHLSSAEYLKTYELSQGEQTESLNSITLLVFQEGENYGYMDISGNVLIEPQYVKANDFCGDMASVAIWKEGVIMSGDVILDKYPLYGYINKSGELIIPYQYVLATDFKDKYAFVQDENFKYYYIDKEGIKQPFEAGEGFHGGKTFSNGYAATHLSGGNRYPPMRSRDIIPEVWTYIDETGKRATDMTFEYAGSFSEEYAIVNKTLYGVIDRDFNTVIKCRYFSILLCEGYSLFAVHNGLKWGIIDSKGNTIIRFMYDDFEGFGDGLFCFKKGEYYGYVDIYNQTIVPFIYPRATSFNSGYATVMNDEHMWQLIDTNGEYILTDISNSYAILKNDAIYTGHRPVDPVTGFMDVTE